MKIAPDTALNSVCIHPTKGPGILRVNYTITQQGVDCLPGWPSRLIQIEFPNSRQWEYVLPTEEFSDVIRSTAFEFGKA
jgi:hypothetical protein